MLKYKYESTQKIYNYINESNDFFISKDKIQNKFKDMNSSKIYKALSDLNKDSVIFRTDRGEYINHSEATIIEKIRNSRGERTKFNVIKSLISIERPELSERYNEIRMFRSPFFLSYDMGFTTQIPNLRVSIIDLNKHINLADELANISSIFIDENNASKPSVYSVYNKTLGNLLIDFIKTSSRATLKNIVEIFNQEYSKIIEIEEREDSEESPKSLGKYLYNNIDRHMYNQLVDEGLNNYIVNIK